MPTLRSAALAVTTALLPVALAVTCATAGCGEAVPAGHAADDVLEAKRAAAGQAGAGAGAGAKSDSAGGDPCALHGWYGDGQCDRFCAAPDPDCQPAEPAAAPSGSAARLPIVLAHGFNASPRFFGFKDVAATLRADGHTVLEAEVAPFAGVEARAAELARQVDRVLAESGQPRVNLIAHSMGGLDARHLISRLGYADRVASLTTLSTPHRGSRVADALLGLVRGTPDRLLDDLARLLGTRYSTVADDPDLRAVLTDLSEQAALRFNAATPDAPGVRYRSYAGLSNVLGIANPADAEACQGQLRFPAAVRDRMSPLLVPMAAVVAHGQELRPNDGLVTVESARWGEFQGCIPADHAGEVGQLLGRSGPDPLTGYDHLTFYRQLAFDLAALGF
jgi:triacylglycerol lipase